MTPPGVSVQIVDEIAAPDDKHSFFTQWSEPFPDLIVKFGRLCFVNTELDTGTSASGKMPKHGPSAVIESPLLIKSDVDRRQLTLDAPGKLRIAGSGLHNFIKF